jgi:hypothetical protein
MWDNFSKKKKEKIVMIRLWGMINLYFLRKKLKFNAQQ